MTLHIKVDLDNDAFMPAPEGEVSRILLEFARQLARLATDGDCCLEAGAAGVYRDENGTTVGQWEVSNLFRVTP